MIRKLWLLAALASAALAYGETADTPDRIEAGKNTFELGVVAGFPALVGVELGWWNVGGAPVLLRLNLGGAAFTVVGGRSTETFGYGAAALDAGWIFDRKGKFKQWIGVSGGVGGGSTETFGFVGPSWGFHFAKAFTVTVGPTVFFNSLGTFVPIPYGKIGASWFL